MTSSVAIIIEHQTKPGKREEVRRIWEKHMAPAIAANPSHTAYFYCLDINNQDRITAFQRYVSAEAAQEFLKAKSYLEYTKEVEPLLLGQPRVTTLTPVWSKEASNSGEIAV